MFGGKDEGERSFTVEASSIDETGGRYLNKAPLQAAHKAARVLFSTDKGKKQTTIKLQLRESTRGTGDKLFAYEAKKENINKVIKINGKDVVFKKRIKVTKGPRFHGDGARKQKQ